jgi:hypothetical protein
MQNSSFPVTEDRIAVTLQALKKNEFLSFFLPTVLEAREMVMHLVREGMRVGLGESRTLRQMDLSGSLRKSGAVLLDPSDPSLSAEELVRCRREQILSDLFLASVYAVTEHGELVSRDGIGNRISATSFGPKKVVLLVGSQKIVPDLHAAFLGIDGAASPPTKSPNPDFPCAEDGGCVHVSDPNRICRATLILHRRPLLTDITVILIGEPIGS